MIDAPTYTRATFDKLRMGGIKCVALGDSPDLVAVGMGIHRWTIYRWLADYHVGGDAAPAAKSIPGALGKLTCSRWHG